MPHQVAGSRCKSEIPTVVALHSPNEPFILNLYGEIERLLDRRGMKQLELVGRNMVVMGGRPEHDRCESMNLLVVLWTVPLRHCRRWGETKSRSTNNDVVAERDRLTVDRVQLYRPRESLSGCIREFEGDDGRNDPDRA
ncbi:hypothetical protein LXL04_007831 [Taraxacum kok-saghyz]